MRNLFYICMIILLMGKTASTAAQDSVAVQLPEPDDLRIQIYHIQKPIKLDGMLDEPEWQAADQVSTFWQYMPLDRVPPTEKTIVRVVQDDQHIYFGVLCYDREPDKVVAWDMRRDSGLTADSFVGLSIDTYNDHRNFYYFSTNPLGIRRDGIVTDQRYYNSDWDGIWECKSVRTEFGWSTEMKIPFSTLRFGGDQPMTWGFNISRMIRRKQERAYWAPIPRELGHRGSWRGELFGHIDGIRTTVATKQWEVEPFLLSGGQKTYHPAETDSRFDIGGDIRYNFTPNLRGDLSIQTDFAQVEADQEIVNFTRFPLFFPEKREFFLDNADLFRVGIEEDIMMFYSRRIGLSGGSEIPILGAGKLSGRVGEYSIGLLNVQTEEKDFPAAGGMVREPETNYSVIRLKRDIFANSSIGVMMTNKERGSQAYNRLAAVDGNIRFSPSVRMEGFFAQTYTCGLSLNDICGVGKIQFTEKNFIVDVQYSAIGEDFNPEMGFVYEQNLRSSLAGINYTQWVNTYRIQNITWSGSYRYRTLYNYDFYGRSARGGVEVKFNTGDQFSYKGSFDTDRIRNPFAIGPVRITPDDFHNETHTFVASSNPSRPFSISAGYSTLEYWGGGTPAGGFIE